MAAVAPTTALPTPDDAFTAFKSAEGTYTASAASQASADAALAQAQTQKASADTDVADAAANVKQTADTLIASLQAYEATLASPTPTTIAVV